MNIGEKIKRIRTAKLMTQRELAGGEITRNMLSRIENGAAQPSMSTVVYIAERLNVSPGFLLAGEEDEWLYFKSNDMNNIKKAYSDKNFRLCREMCKNSEWSDDELVLILCECCLRVGIEDFCNGYLHSAVENLDEALEYCEQTIYNTDIIVAEACAYFEYMKMISPSLSSNVADNNYGGVGIALKNSFCVYSDIFCNSDRNEVLLSTIKQQLSKESSYALHIGARDMMDANDHEGAKNVLHKLLFDDNYELPEPMLYFVFCDYEVCCKETGDFKGAYEYSGNKIALLQKLLA